MVSIMRRSYRKSLLWGLWETLLHPDREELAMKERLVVISAANQLQVGEFQLLQLAYREWFDEVGLAGFERVRLEGGYSLIVGRKPD